MTPDVDDGTPCPVTGCTGTLAGCLARADQVWPDDPHAHLYEDLNPGARP